jgi:hypothetical protein
VGGVGLKGAPVGGAGLNGGVGLDDGVAGAVSAGGFAGTMPRRREDESGTPGAR